VAGVEGRCNSKGRFDGGVESLGERPYCAQGVAGGEVGARENLACLEAITDGRQWVSSQQRAGRGGPRQPRSTTAPNGNNVR